MKALPRARKVLGGNKTLLIPFGLAGVTLWFRLNQLGSLPPGLHTHEAELGLKAQSSKLLSSLSEVQQLLTVLVAKFGLAFESHKILGLRLGFALASAAASIFIFLWVKKAFGRRPAIIAGLVAASLPLVLNLSRFGGGYALVLLFYAASLYYLTSFWQKPKAPALIGLVVALTAGLYSHPSFNWFVLALAVAGIFNLAMVRKFKSKRAVKGALSLLAYLLVAAPAAPSAIRYFSSVNFSGAVERFGTLLRTLIVSTSESGVFSLAAKPLLNAFVTLMLILGVLVCSTQLKRAAHRSTLALFIVGILPFVLLPSAPLAERLVGLVIPIVALSAIGTDYLLGQWHRTFPINSAARQVGSLMLVVLLFFSARHGYQQYFLAWRASSETKEAYSFRQVAAADFVQKDKVEGDRFVIGVPDEIKVVQYLAGTKAQYASTDQIKTLPKLSGPRQFVLLPKAKESAFDSLAAKFPGGKLEPKLSTQNEELFLIYNVRP